LLADFLLARAAENEPRRFSCPIDVALGQQQFAFSLEETEFETTGACVTNQNFHTSLFSMAASYSSPSELALNMPSIVPQPDDWLRQVVFVTQRTHARGAQREVSTERDIKPEPTSGQYSQEMPARKKQHVTFDRAHALHHAICSCANLVWRFPSGAAIAKQLPIRALLLDAGGQATLILAIVPFEQVPLDFRHRAKTSQFAGPGGTLQGAGKHLGESYSPQPFLQPTGIALATFCKRQIGKSRVLARERPRGFSVSGQVNDGKLVAHALLSLVVLSIGGTWNAVISPAAVHGGRSQSGSSPPCVDRPD